MKHIATLLAIFLAIPALAQQTYIQCGRLIDGKSNLVLLDIYYPENLSYTQYHPVLKEWNGLVYKYASKNDYSVLKISKVLTKTEDFSFGIEPSATGGRKIVDTIISSY